MSGSDISLAGGSDDVLERVRRLRPTIEAHREDAERRGRISPEVLTALRQEGLFALLLPRELGGLGADPITAVSAVEALARIDGAVAWNVNVAGSAAVNLARLDRGGITRILGGHDLPPVLASAASPQCTATAVEGGLRVSGEVRFVSGCEDAEWILVIALVTPPGGADDPPPAPDIRAVFVPRSDVEVLDTWRVMGMRGTGSSDIALEGVLVTDELTVPVVRPPEAPGLSAATLAVFPWQVIHGEAVVSLGIAASALERATRLATTRVPANTTRPASEREMTQMNLAKARTRIESAGAYLYGTLSQAVAAGTPVQTESKVSLQLAACLAAEAGAEAVELLYESLGSEAFFERSGIERDLRDTRVLTQHAAKSAARYVSAGRVMLGMPSDAVLLR